jgi:gluconolactonase
MKSNKFRPRPSAPLISALLAAALGDCVLGSAGAQEATTATDRLQLSVPEISVVGQLPRFGEGVVFDGDGQLYVSDPFGNAVLRVTEGRTPEVWAEVQMPNGHKVLPDGTHVVLEQGDEGGAVAHLGADGEVIRRIELDDEGRSLRFPNDLTSTQKTAASTLLTQVLYGG